MPHRPNRGRVYRRCACRNSNDKQLGARCPDLRSSPRHGTWSFAVDMPNLDKKRATLRRGGFASKKIAQDALAHVLACERAGIATNDHQTVADYLTTWLRDKTTTVKPSTAANYIDYVNKDLIPALGAIAIERLSHHHVAQFVHDQIAAGRGLTTLRRCVATLSSALNDAVRQHRLPHNPAHHAPVPRPPKTEQVCWTPTQAATFLRHCADTDDPLRNLYELIIGTGLRKGEALALHWADVSLDESVLFVRYTLSSIRNSTTAMTSPKTRSSHDWVSLSSRVRRALDRQALHQAEAGLPGESDLVFCRADGEPLRPEYIVRHLHELTDALELPRVRVHDLRHLAATLMISSQVPIAMASKTLRHSKLSTTVDTYGHLAPYAAHNAVTAIETALDAADSDAA